MVYINIPVLVTWFALTVGMLFGQVPWWFVLTVVLWDAKYLMVFWLPGRKAKYEQQVKLAQLKRLEELYPQFAPTRKPEDVN